MALDTGGAAIVCRGVDVWAGNNPLILDVNWSIMPGERWAIQGTNGCGKSTLLRAIGTAARGETGNTEDDGVLQVSSSLRMGMLEQTAVSGSDKSVREEVVSRMVRYQAAKQALDAATEECVIGSSEELDCLDKAQVEFEACGGYQIEARISRVLQGLGFQPVEFDSKCSSFSGGWQMRIGLARLLLSEPELLIMDEPTNHLDASARRWLGDYVGGYDGTVLVVSHDAEFVRRAAESIAEVAGGRLQLYKSCSFDKFLTERDERQARVVATVEAQERERKRMQDFIDRMGAKASKATQAKDREGKLRKLAVEQAATKALLIGEQRKPALTLARPPSCGMAPLALRGANIRHPLGSVDIISGAQLEVLKGMRLILRGPNGAGKSTILKALSGQIPLGAGQRFEDDRLELGFFAQDLAQDLPQDMAACEYVADTVRSADPSITDESCRTIMGSLGLIGEKATRQIGSLSGGEKARVALATFCLTPCNVILLDEPTNHLDVDAVAALLEAIGKYEGAVVVVSHDRAFCEAIEATHVGYVADGKISVAERSLRETDFSEEDRGVVNVVAAEESESSADFSSTLPEPSTAAPAPTRPQKPKRDPEAAKLAAATAKAAVDAAIAEVKAASLDNAVTPPLPPPPTPKPAPPAAPPAPSQRELAKGIAASAAADAAKRAASKKEKKVKVSKKERAEYETIEAEVGALEVACAEAEAAFEEAKSRTSKRLTLTEQMAMADAALSARKAADEKLERYLELEELISKADAQSVLV